MIEPEPKPKPVFPNEILFQVLLSLNHKEPLSNMALCSRELFAEFKKNYGYCVHCREWENIYTKKMSERTAISERILTCCESKGKYNCNILCKKCFNNGDNQCTHCNIRSCNKCIKYVTTRDHGGSVCKDCFSEKEKDYYQCVSCKNSPIIQYIDQETGESFEQLQLSYECDDCEGNLCDNCVIIYFNHHRNYYRRQDYCRNCVQCYICNNHIIGSFKLFEFRSINMIICTECINDAKIYD